MIVSVIGLGLIGGSLALNLKACGFCSRIIGVDSNIINAEKALQLNLADEISDLKRAVKQTQLIIIATPVDSAPVILQEVLDLVEDQTVIDVGSTKAKIIKTALSRTNRRRFVATHPIWGTENSGPESAMEGKLKGNITVICNPGESDADALQITKRMYESLGMKIIYMEAEEHDLHAAYVSHISHISSFALALSVLAKEKKTDTIFQLAGAGFESAVRLAKSNPDTWTPIFRQNRSNIIDVLNEQINQMNRFKRLLQAGEYQKIYDLIVKANEIRKIFNK